MDAAGSNTGAFEQQTEGESTPRQVPGTPDAFTYTSQPYDVAAETVAISAPVKVTCQR